MPSRNSHTCPWWLLFTFDNPLRKLLHNPRHILDGMIKPGDIALDVGCGMGYFTLTLADLVGEGGHVIAADLQAQMLAGLHRRAERTGLLERIRFLQTTPQRIGVTEPLDFGLAFWMVHEVRAPELFLGEILAALKPGGKLLIVEPRLHVSASDFNRTLEMAQRLGFIVAARPPVSASRTVLLSKGN